MLILSELFVALAAGCLVFVDIHGTHARPLAAAPGEHAYDDFSRSLSSYNGSRSLNSTVDVPISIRLTPTPGDGLYFASLRIAANLSPFRLVADTGSTDFWVYSSASPARGIKNTLNAPVLAGTGTAIMGYENGLNLKIEIVREAINWGGKVLTMPFAAATAASGNFATLQGDGVLGFGLPVGAFNSLHRPSRPDCCNRHLCRNQSGTRIGLPSVVDTLVLSGFIPSRVSGWKLSRGLDKKNDGQVVLGGVNTDMFIPESMVTVSNLDAFHWKVPIDAASIGNIRVINSPRVGIIDTGSGAILVPSSDAAALHAFIPGAVVALGGQYFLPCNNQAVLSLSIGKVFWLVDPRDLVSAPAPPDAGLRNYCFSSMQPSSARLPGEWLVGSTFLKNVYMKLDPRKNTVGFALLQMEMGLMSFRDGLVGRGRHCASASPPRVPLIGSVIHAPRAWATVGGQHGCFALHVGRYKSLTGPGPTFHSVVLLARAALEGGDTTEPTSPFAAVTDGADADPCIAIDPFAPVETAATTTTTDDLIADSSIVNGALAQDMGYRCMRPIFPTCPGVLSLLTIINALDSSTGCLVFVDIRGAHARPLVVAPSEHALDDPLRILDSYNGTHSPNFTVDALLGPGVQRRNAQPISIPLVPGEGDALYFAALRIGSNPNPFRIIADTGSTDFWVYSSTCPTRGNKNSVNAPVLPGTATANFGYENGVTLKAGVVRDTVNFGGHFLGMPFAAATEVSESIANRPEEGVMGFALASGSRVGLPPVLDLLALSGVIPERVTGWKLSRSSDGKNDGELVLGGVNTAKFIPESMVAVKNLDAIHWRAQVDAAAVGNIRVINSPRVAIFDTGALHITTSFSDAAMLHAAIPFAIVTITGQYFLPCNNQAVLSLSIGGVFWTVDPRDLVNAPAPPQAGLHGYCFSSIQPTPARQPGEWLVGSMFLKNVYMKLDSTANTIGFAHLR
ncbi:hypothetical protein EVG20_g5558 [Dentipellis fragilis]|uniref:Peptidase A1 domain-containing protein n=1 Tax=Dentipellis fragilis TaxID=205917 RepID=A0A4Y9YVD2_9AGAM|nr:hypothetical protein EVG20_g5558 [Dentipellis fragilis]